MWGSGDVGGAGVWGELGMGGGGSSGKEILYSSKCLSQCNSNTGITWYYNSPF